MSDRDLELAAKAAGKTRAEWDYDWLMANGTEVARDMLWDPRRDSGQAFDMAVKLNIRFGTTPGGSGYAEDMNGEYYTMFSPGTDQCAMARLAVFDVAVQLGRVMP